MASSPEHSCYHCRPARASHGLLPESVLAARIWDTLLGLERHSAYEILPFKVVPKTSVHRGRIGYSGYRVEIDVTMSLVPQLSQTTPASVTASPMWLSHRMRLVRILSSIIIPSSSPTSIASLKARWHNWGLSWNLTWRCKARGRCKSRNTLWWRKSWRRIVETGWHEGLRSAISSL